MSNYCDLTCRYFSFPDVLQDGSKTCRTFIAVFCKKHKKIGYKNVLCKDYKEALGDTNSKVRIKYGKRTKNLSKGLKTA